MLLRSYLAWGFAVLLGFVLVSFAGVRAPRIDLDDGGGSGYYGGGTSGGHGSGGFGGSSGWGWGK
ncbi:MAG: hypothetical protein U0939_15625 [Pirellulales bacterium]